MTLVPQGYDIWQILRYYGSFKGKNWNNSQQKPLHILSVGKWNAAVEDVAAPNLFLIKIWPQLCFIFRETSLLMMWINVLFEKHPSTFLCQEQLISWQPWGKKDQGSTFYFSEKLESYRAVGRRVKRKS